jgi:TolA-binding protein
MTQRISGLVAVLMLVSLAVRGASGADDETRAYNAAAKALQDGLADRAEREMAAFVQKYPASSRLPDAILLQARAAFSQKKVDPALDLLVASLPRAGQLADQYRFWLGKMRMEKADYKGAAAEFGALLTEHTNSTRRLEAAYGEALARFELQEWARAAELLRKPGGAFQQAARAGGNSELLARGQLLLAEALLRQQELPAAEAAAGQVATNLVDIAWSRQFLLCRIQLASDRAGMALANTTNLLALAAATARPVLLAESYALQGAILEQLKQSEAAMAAYERIQTEKVPEQQRRDAFLRVVDLTLAQNNLPAATARLEKYLAAHPEDAACDAVLLTLGDLRLKQHLLARAAGPSSPSNDPAVPGTNNLQQAILLYDQLIQKYPRSPYVGKAQVNRGWALLADGNLVEAQAAFKLATDKLPLCEDQAIARFKLADTQFLQNDVTNALAGYRRIIEDYGGLPRVRTGLFDRAWYQIARACVRTGDLKSAQEAMRRVLVLYPASLYSERILLLLGQELNRTNRAVEARGLFTEFAQQFTNSALLPEVQLAIARSHELEGNWKAAIRAYDEVLARFPTNAVVPRAEYQRGLACDRAGWATNALQSLTAFLARYPTNELAPQAQDWLGDYHYRNDDFVEAERDYQRLYQNTNWIAGELGFLAKFKAGRAALMRQGYDDATNYFLGLINDKRCPDALVAETFFAYGDTLITRPQGPENTNALARFETALETFRKIPQLYPSSPLVPRAWGRMADCHFQLATLDPRRYTNAIDAYKAAMNSPEADVRSQAEVGLAHCLERQAQLALPPDAALLKSALDHYLNVVYGRNLTGDEAPVPLWVKEAGLAAARLLESQNRWSEAVQLYGRLQQMLPPLGPTLERRMAQAREQVGARTE